MINFLIIDYGHNIRIDFNTIVIVALTSEHKYDNQYVYKIVIHDPKLVFIVGQLRYKSEYTNYNLTWFTNSTKIFSFKLEVVKYTI